ncbi:Cyclic AMP-dependent transcription factor ATF-4 [Aphelenchoides avenae]|nr:Cyclic AMP-dependent transcription factor ATF-4 [Aphelenchus avenae]
MPRQQLRLQPLASAKRSLAINRCLLDLCGTPSTIENRERELRVPIIGDPFIGTKPPQPPERPLCAAFVGPNQRPSYASIITQIDDSTLHNGTYYDYSHASPDYSDCHRLYDGSTASLEAPTQIYNEITRECAELERTPPRDENGRAQKSVMANSEHQRQSPPTFTPEPSPGRASSSASGASNDRKRQMNRIAATKYREKKRLEREQQAEELAQLENRIAELKTEANALEGEISYLRRLLGEIEARRRS